MKTCLRVSLPPLVFILIFLLGVNLTQAQGNSDIDEALLIVPPPRYPWAIQYVHQELDPPRDVGRFVSMALRPFDDYPVISYYDYTKADLMLAIPVPALTGNCGTFNNWLCESIDGSGILNVGMFSSIDIWGYSSASWKVGISYYDDTFRALKAAIWTCSSGSCNKEIITILTPDSVQMSYGLYPSIKFNSDGVAAIASFYYNSGSNSSDLIYAEQVLGEGNCGVGAAFGFWNCTLISFLSDQPKYTSLDFNYEDKAYIAYYYPEDESLRIAYDYGSAAMCDEFDWTCRTIDGGVDDVGSFSSLVAPQFSGDSFHIAYLDKTNGHLKYYNEDWGPVVVDEMSTTYSPKGISLKFDHDGYPAIAYQYIASEYSPPALRIARPWMVYEDGHVGNCGDNPPGYSVKYWRCNTIDYGGQYIEEAGYASMVINSNGRVGIAYSEFDTDLVITSLKFTYQTLYRTFLPLTVKP